MTVDRWSCESRHYETISHLFCELLKTFAEYNIPKGISQNVTVS
jgi:hypothetical protein